MANISIFRISAVVVIVLALSFDAFAQMGSSRGLMRNGGFWITADQRVADQQRSREPAMVSPTAPVQTYETQNRRTAIGNGLDRKTNGLILSCPNLVRPGKLNTR